MQHRVYSAFFCYYFRKEVVVWFSACWYAILTHTAATTNTTTAMVVSTYLQTQQNWNFSDITIISIIFCVSGDFCNILV